MPAWPGAPELAQDSPPGDGPGASAPPAPAEAAGTGLHEVVLAERAGQLVVAAAAPPLDGDGRALLRRLVREILSARGLSLADFHLNGVSLGTDFQEITGGSHGSRSR